MRAYPIVFSIILFLACPYLVSCNAAENGVPFDLQGFIDRELHAGKTKVVVPPGRYRVTPSQQRHLVLRDLHDVEITADGVEMICTETTQAVSIANCRNVTLRGLTIDYDPLPFTQGRITGFSADKGLHEIELFEGYPPAESARPFKYEIFRPDTRTLRCDDRYPAKVEVVDARHIRVVHPGGRATDPEQVGDLVVLGAEYAPHGSAGHAVECSNGHLAPAGAHQNIVIRGNRVKNCPRPGIRVTSTRGLTIEGNELDLNDLRGAKKRDAVEETNCEQ